MLELCLAARKFKLGFSKVLAIIRRWFHDMVNLTLSQVLLERHRRRILRRFTACRELSPSAAADDLGIKPSIVAFHFGVLRRAGFIEPAGRKNERPRAYRLTDRGLAVAKDYGLDKEARDL